MAGTPPFRIEVEGLDEFRAAVRKAQGDLPKKLGQVNKSIGAFVIGKLHPPSVGEGAGAKVRPSATVREVLIRVGGGHRGAENKLQWGKKQDWPDGHAPERPDIIGTARRHQREIEDRYLKAITDNFKPPFQ